MTPLAKPEGLVLWIHGRSGAGKTTLACLLGEEIRCLHPCVILDGDAFRKTVSADLGFDPESRWANILRAAGVARLLAEQGITVLAAFETPTQELRTLARSVLNGVRFLEVALVCSLECCRRRDPKGIYSAAKEGHLRQLSGVDAPLEPSANAELIIDTELCSLSDAVKLMKQAMVASPDRKP